MTCQTVEPGALIVSPVGVDNAAESKTTETESQENASARQEAALERLVARGPEIEARALELAAAEPDLSAAVIAPSAALAGAAVQRLVTATLAERQVTIDTVRLLPGPEDGIVRVDIVATGTLDAVAGGIAALENARPSAYVQTLEIGPRGRSASDTAGPE
ncbi:MAG: GspMb/PilO family protein, partial [Pseudomonadota bacterium]